MRPAGTTQVDGFVLSDSIAAGLRIIALRALGDEEDAADAVQETLARAVEAMREDRIPAGVPLGAFVHGIARHVIVDQLRRRGKQPHAIEPDRIPSVSPSPLESLIQKEEVARVTRELARLPRLDRELLVRCYVHGERLVDIARSTGEPVERVRKRKSRVLARIRANLANVPGGHDSAAHTTLSDDDE